MGQAQWRSTRTAWLTQSAWPGMVAKGRAGPANDPYSLGAAAFQARNYAEATKALRPSGRRRPAIATPSFGRRRASAKAKAAPWRSAATTRSRRRPRDRGSATRRRLREARCQIALGQNDAARARLNALLQVPSHQAAAQQRLQQLEPSDRLEGRRERQQQCSRSCLAAKVGCARASITCAARETRTRRRRSRRTELRFCRVGQARRGARALHPADRAAIASTEPRARARRRAPAKRTRSRSLECLRTSWPDAGRRRRLPFPRRCDDRSCRERVRRHRRGEGSAMRARRSSKATSQVRATRSGKRASRFGIIPSASSRSKRASSPSHAAAPPTNRSRSGRGRRIASRSSRRRR